VRELQWGNLEGFGESISLHQEPWKQPASASSISSSQNKPVVQQQSNRKIIVLLADLGIAAIREIYKFYFKILFNYLNFLIKIIN
jgi:hypothetical protein